MKKLEIIDSSTVFEKFVFKINEFRLRHEKLDGTMSNEMTRLVFQRGESAAALVHHTDTQQLLFTRQFRLPICGLTVDTPGDEAADGWLVEIAAGIVDAGESPEEAIRREIEEEMGFVPNNVEPIGAVYASPGGSSELIHIFYATVDKNSRRSDGGGAESEGEDIEVVEFSREEVIDQMQNGQLNDAKTLIALQWFAANR